MSNITVSKQGFALAPNNFAEAMEYAKMIAASDLAPKDFKGKAGNIIVAIQMGSEIGLSPMQSLQNIAIINGKPCLWGDALLALVQSSPEFEDIQETVDDDQATCMIKRKGKKEHIETYTKDDAIKAGLWNKPGPWKQYPKRMMQMRARGFALRNKFADSLMGLNIAEEVRDYIDITPEKEMPAAVVQENKIIKYEDESIEIIEKESLSEGQVKALREAIENSDLTEDVFLLKTNIKKLELLDPSRYEGAIKYLANNIKSHVIKPLNGHYEEARYTLGLQ